MASFDHIQGKTAGKMSDLVMEYVSQFIARDYLEAYERAMKEASYEFVPPEFDEKIYKKITKLIRKKTGYNVKIFRIIIYVVVGVLCALSIAFAVFILMNSALRQEVFDLIGVL